VHFQNLKIILCANVLCNLKTGTFNTVMCESFLASPNLFYEQATFWHYILQCA